MEVTALALVMPSVGPLTLSLTGITTRVTLTLIGETPSGPEVAEQSFLADGSIDVLVPAGAQYVVLKGDATAEVLGVSALAPVPDLLAFGVPSTVTGVPVGAYSYHRIEVVTPGIYVSKIVRIARVATQAVGFRKAA